MASLMASMQSPDAASSIESRLASLKEDPELAPVLQEIEQGGPTAMMKYWNDPAVLEKLSKAMGGAFGGAALGGAGAAAAAAAAAGEGGEEAAAADGDGDEAAATTVLEAATKGDAAALQKLIDGGADCNEADEEERSALHFASGYGELDCVRVLVKAGVKIDAGEEAFFSFFFAFFLTLHDDRRRRPSLLTHLSLLSPFSLFFLSTLQATATATPRCTTPRATTSPSA